MHHRSEGLVQHVKASAIGLLDCSAAALIALDASGHAIGGNLS